MKQSQSSHNLPPKSRPDEERNQQVTQTTQALEPLTQATLDEWAEKGIQPSLEQIVRLNDAARLVAAAVRDVHARGIPIKVGDLGAECWLWPMTIQASRWFIACLGWFEGDADAEVQSLAFAMAHSRDTGVFDPIWSAADAARAIDDWLRCCAATHDELIIGINMVNEAGDPLPRAGTPDDDSSKPQPDGGAFSGLVAMMTDRTGVPPEVWESGVTMDYLLTHVHAVAAQSAAEGSLPDQNDPWVRANRALGLVEMDIIQDHKQKQAEAVHT